MAGKFGGYGDDEEEDVLAPKEPQVTSQDPEERKSARALRIRRRQEALKRAEQPAEEAAVDEEPGPIEQATATAAEELQRLALDGAAKVTNVKVTTDEREVIRRSLFSEKMRNSMKKIEEEATDAQTQYEAITNTWGPMLEIKDPLDIDAAIKEQKQRCDALLEQKNQLIDELKGDLKRMDQAYYDDLDKQDKDIKELSDRIEKQVTIMQRAYEKQLSLIEQAINIEREVMVDHNNKRWEALYKQRDREEVAHMEFKFEQLDEHKQEVEAIMWDHHGKYRQAKIELESLIQELQKELEKLKATCIINTEKIGYNYQVLKKREEENVFVRSQQKRKLNKMSDVANSLRSKIRKAAEDGAIEEMKADAEIVKLMQTMDDLEKKSYHFAHVNHYKFSQKRKLNKMSDVANSLRSKIRKAAEDGAIEEMKADAEIVKLMQTMDDLEKKSYHFSHVNHYKFSQKRKLNKMSDVANSLRSKIRKAAEDGAVEEMKADAEIVKLMQTMDDLEKKSYHFSHVNHYKFSQVWRMSAARCAALARSVRQAEVALHAHVLAEPPPPAPAPPHDSPLAKLEHEEEQKAVPSTAIVPREPIDPKNMVAKEAKDKLVRHILQLVADNTGFLVEDRLLKLIEKYQLSARNLCTLDSIFMALEIQAEEDIELLCSTFLNYAFCPICVGMEAASEQMDQLSMLSTTEESPSHHTSIGKGPRSERASMRGRASSGRSISASTSRSAHIAFRAHELTPADQQLLTEADEIIQKCGDPRAVPFASSSTTDATGQAASRRGGTRGVTVALQPNLAEDRKPNPFLCPVGHYLEIEPMQVLTALGEFISVFVPPEKRKLYDLLDSVKPPDFGTPSRKLKPEEIEQYWSQWKNVFPAEKDRFWDGLLTGLNNYLPILQERERLHEEVVVLRRRNAALRRLVRGALPELAASPPRYARPAPHGLTAPFPDEAPEAHARLPPI